MKHVLAIIALLFGLSPALADDQFAGAYIGAHGGYSVMDNEPSFNGYNIGVQGGYNYALGGGFILGGEVDGSWSTANVKGTDGSLAFKYSQDWMISTRARLGYEVGSFLPYLTAGAAWGKFKFIETEAKVTTTGSETPRLWVLGGGIDYRLPKTNVVLTAGVLQFFDTSVTDGMTQLRLGANLKLN